MSRPVTVSFLGGANNLLRTIDRVQRSLIKVRLTAMTAAGGVTASVGSAAAAPAALLAVPAIITGIAVKVAAESEKVKKAWGGVGKHVNKTLQTFAKPIQDNLIKAAGSAKRAFNTVAPALKQVFAQTGPVIDGVFKRLQPIAKELGPFIKQSFKAGVPVLMEFLNGLKPIIGGLTDMFAIFSKMDVAGPIGTIMGLISSLLPIVAQLIAAFSPLGTDVLKVVSSLAIEILNKLVPAVKGIIKAVQENGSKFMGLFEAVKNIIIALMPIGVSLLTSILELAGSIAENLTPTFENVNTFIRENGALVKDAAVAIGILIGVVKVITTVQAVWNAVTAANPISLLILGITALVAAIVIAYRQSETFRTVVKFAFNEVKNAAVALWNGIRVAWNNITSAFSSGARKAVGFLKQIPDFFRNLPGRLLGWGKSMIDQLISGIRSRAGAVLDVIRSIVPDPLESFLRLRSPAKKGPLSLDGGPEGWGRKFVEQYARGMTKGNAETPAIDMARRLAGSGNFRGFAGAAGGVMTMGNITINATTNASAKGIADEIAWLMKTRGR